MNKTILLTVMLLTLCVGLTSAASGICSDLDIQNFSSCYGSNIWNDPYFTNTCGHYDSNHDLAINLTDLVAFAKYCYSQ